MTATTPLARTGLVVREAAAAERDGWDDIVRRFPHRVTHLRSWLESLEACGFGRTLYLLFERDGEIVGALPGQLSSVGPVKIFGSPREGCQTVSMGPAHDAARLPLAELLAAVVPYLEQVHGTSHIELMDQGLDAAALRAAGFDGWVVPTYKAPLTPGDEAATFARFKDSARRNVRRAERLGLVTRFEDDESFVDEHYEQLVEVYERGGHSIPFSKQRVLECWRRLKAAGRLIAVASYLPDGRTCIATGMFFVEDRELTLWMWAHRTHYRWYRPTEQMTWLAMRRAMELGCDTFDFMGRGEFKAKFGAGPDESKWRWMRSRSRWLKAARATARAAYHVQQKVRGSLANAARSFKARRGERRAIAALVLGDQDLVRALALGHVPSVVMARAGSPARYSRSLAGTLEFVDGWSRPEELVDRMVSYGLAQAEPPVLMYQDDQSLLLLSRHRDRLRQAFRFVVPDAKLVEQLVDKQQFQQLARRLRLPVPEARAFTPAEQPCPATWDIEFPVVVKPVTRRNDVWGPLADGKALRFDTPEQLREFWPRLGATPVLVQRHIAGGETQIESYHAYIDERGDTVADFTGRKIRTWPLAYGDSTALEITDAYDVSELGRSILKKLKLRGVAKLDFKRGPDGALWLLEINPRFTLWHHLGAVAGANIPALVYGDLTGRPRPTAPAVRAGVQWCKVWSDYPAARASGVALTRWIPWVLGCEAKSAFAWNDPLPLAGATLWRWTRGRKKRPSLSPDIDARLVPSSVAAR